MKNKKRTIRNWIKVSLATLAIVLFTTTFASINYTYAAAEEPESSNSAPCDNNTANETDAGTSNPCVQPPIIPKPGTLPGPSAITDAGDVHERYFITDLIPTLIRGAINLLGGITIIALMIGGIQYLVAFGDDTKIENAKKNITYAIIGLLIAMFSYTIVRIISDVPLSDTNEVPVATSDETHTTE